MEYAEMLKGKLKTFALPLLALAVTSCHVNDFKEFSDWHIAFDPGNSTSTVINEAGSVVGQYAIHFCTVKRDDTVSVEVEVEAGDGLVEGVDYKLVSPASVKFVPGVYDRVFIIEWLPHELDPSKDNSLTLRLHDCSDSGIVLGMPGPSKRNVSIKINKTK